MGMKNCCGCKQKFFIDCDTTIPEIVYLGNIYTQDMTRIRLTSRDYIPGERSKCDSYTLGFRRQLKELKENPPEYITASMHDDAVFFYSDGGAFVKTYLEILRVSDISQWEPWYEAIHMSAPHTAVPIWDVEVTFTSSRMPKVYRSMMPCLNKPYKGKMGYTGMHIYLENGQPLLVRPGEFASVKIVDIAAEAVNKINAAYYVPRRSTHRPDNTSESRTALIAQIAHTGLPEVARTKVFRLSDPTQLGRLTWCNKPKSILAYDDDPMVREGDWSKDADISRRLVVWFNSAHPIFAFINELHASGQKAKAEAYIRYLYYRLLTKQAGPEFFACRPFALSEYRALAETVEEEYGMFRV